MKLIDVFKQIEAKSIAFVGAGGKTAAMFNLARQIDAPVFVTTTTKIGVDEKDLGDRWIEINSLADINLIDVFNLDGITVFTGAQLDEIHMGGLSLELADQLRKIAVKAGAVLLIEADGAKKKSLKAPLAYEPVIPEFVDLVVVTAGLKCLGNALDDENVHRADKFSELSGLEIGHKIDLDSIIKVLIHKEGGLKGVPSESALILHLTDVKSEKLVDQIRKFSKRLLEKYSSVLISDLDEEDINVKRVIQRTAGIILAAGGASRAGQPKQLLDWFGEPIIRKVVKTALASDLSEIVVVTGVEHDEIQKAISDMDVKIVNNLEWQAGISSSIRKGLKALASNIGAAMFILADQPQIPVRLLNSLIKEHEIYQVPIIHPVYAGKRGNPAIFDKVTFADLRNLEGDSGGRQLFSKFETREIWENDRRMMYDIDTLEDYEDLISEYKKG
jgi:molybdenum cofactor cytidylyltransferase